VAEKMGELKSFLEKGDHMDSCGLTIATLEKFSRLCVKGKEETLLFLLPPVDVSASCYQVNSPTSTTKPS